MNVHQENEMYELMEEHDDLINACRHAFKPERGLDEYKATRLRYLQSLWQEEEDFHWSRDGQTLAQFI